MTALERLADQLESDADQLRIRMGRVLGLIDELRRLPLCEGVSDTQLVEHLCHLSVTVADPHLEEWHRLLKQSVSAQSRALESDSSTLLINSMDPFTLRMARRRYELSRLDLQCCEILMHIRPVERGESWYCSENEIRSFIDLAQDPDA